MFTRMIKLSFFIMLMKAISFSCVFASEVYYDNFDTFENMLRSSDLIILGTVLETRTIDEPHKDITNIVRYSEFSIEEIISNKLIFNDQRIEIKTIDAKIENGKNILAYIPQKAQVGERYIALIKKMNNNYYLIYDSSGLIPINGEKIQDSNENIASYFKKIRSFLSSNDKVFHGYKQSIYPVLKNPLNSLKKEAIIVDSSSKLRSINEKYFRPKSTSHSPKVVTFYINSDGARDADSVQISFNDLKTVVTNALNDWNTITGANISFSVYPYEYTHEAVANNDTCTITFENSGVEWGDYSYGDIHFNAKKKWNLPDQSGGDAFLRRSICHEMGHVVNINDLGFDMGPDSLYFQQNIHHNIMWHSGDSTIVSIESPQLGDKAGAIFCFTDFSETPQVDAIYYIYEMSDITNNLTVSPGKILEIDGVDLSYTAKFASGVKIDVYGTLDLNSANLTRSGASNWSGIDIENGGAVNVLTDDCTIEYADVGIDFLGGTLSCGDNTLIIKDCSTAGVYAYNSGPIIRNVKCLNISGSNGGLLVGGASANPTFSYDTVDYSVHGLYVVGAAASMDYCDIKDNNTDHSIIFSGGGLADLDGHNNIHPKDNYYAICNQSTGFIHAENNFWGVPNPPSSLFQFPNLVDYSDSSTAAIPTAGVYKPIHEIEKPPRKIALDMELNGDFNGAYSIYSDLFAKESKPEWRKFFITSMLRVCDKSTHHYDDLRSMITQELLTAKGTYKGSLDFILCDILYREGKYNDAVNAFKEKVANYQNDQTAVEMYTRISEIYSNYLNDKASGLRYADMAKDINPGSPALRLAYEFAGSSYDPSKYTDVYGIGAPKQEPESQTTATSDFVEVFPNPANPATTISYSLSSPAKVNLTIYNISGQKVATLVDGPVSSGVHAVKFDGSQYGSGLYFFRFASDKFTKTGKMMILK
jgi:hypothetical protein